MNTCQYCKKDFKYNSHLKKHLNSQKPCYIPKRIKNIEDYVDDNRFDNRFDIKTKKKGYYKKDDNLFYCIFCDKGNEKLDNAINHVKKNCIILREKIKKQYEEKNKIITLKNYNLIEPFLDKMHYITKKIVSCSDKIIGIEEENVDFITTNIFHNIISSPKKAIQKLNKMISFNKKYINQWNIHPLKENYYLYYRNKNWKIEHRDLFVENLITYRLNTIYNIQKDNIFYFKCKIDRFDDYYYEFNDLPLNKKKSDEYEKLKNEIIDDLNYLFIENILNFNENDDKFFYNYFQ